MSFQNNANAERKCLTYRYTRSVTILEAVEDTHEHPHACTLEESSMKKRYTNPPGSSSPWIVTADIHHGQIQASQKRQLNKLMAPSQADKSGNRQNVVKWQHA